jgi:hypothetical protein
MMTMALISKSGSSLFAPESELPLFCVSCMFCVACTDCSLSLFLSPSSLPPLSPAFAHEPPKGIGCKPQLSKIRAREYKVHSSKNMSHTHVYNKDLVRRRRRGFWCPGRRITQLYELMKYLGPGGRGKQLGINASVDHC